MKIITDILEYTIHQAADVSQDLHFLAKLNQLYQHLVIAGSTRSGGPISFLFLFTGGFAALKTNLIKSKPRKKPPDIDIFIPVNYHISIRHTLEKLKNAFPQAWRIKLKNYHYNQTNNDITSTDSKSIEKLFKSKNNKSVNATINWSIPNTLFFKEYKVEYVYDIHTGPYLPIQVIFVYSKYFNDYLNYLYHNVFKLDELILLQNYLWGMYITYHFDLTISQNFGMGKLNQWFFFKNVHGYNLMNSEYNKIILETVNFLDTKVKNAHLLSAFKDYSFSQQNYVFNFNNTINKIQPLAISGSHLNLIDYFIKNKIGVPLKKMNKEQMKLLITLLKNSFENYTKRWLKYSAIVSTTINQQIPTLGFIILRYIITKKYIIFR